ncbi:hypothetical protein AOC36_07405 [Erysipelothrix larvae]|uniref:Uncharacterized protein n=1 Tax=Erysipelothrix larvae TaxID=1514105 RepID=A0A0X8H0L4_9FIRM|nr:hypothetical protein [Erysipelothrix larvae]AMC93815.1 hypothetical protein AOC36_07405 [Erysipelothrix larvae]
MSIFVIALNQNLFEEGDNKLNPRIQTSVSKIVSYINIDDHVILTLPPTIQSTQNQQAISIDKKGLNLKKAFQEAFNKRQCDCTVIYEPNSLVINKTETIYRDFDSVHRIKFNRNAKKSPTSISGG